MCTIYHKLIKIEENNSSKLNFTLNQEDILGDAGECSHLDSASIFLDGCHIPNRKCLQEDQVRFPY